MNNQKKNISYVLISTYFLRIIKFPYMIFFAKILSPEGLGIWQTLDVFRQYISVIGIGIVASTERLVPYALTKNNKKKVKKLISLGTTYSFIQSIILSLFFLFFVLFYYDFETSPFYFGLISISFTFILDQFIIVKQTYLKALNNFKTYSNQLIIYGLIDLLLLVYAYFFGIYGVIIGSIFNYCLKFIISFYSYKKLDNFFQAKIYVNFKELLKHLNYGYKMSIYKISILFSRRLDSLFIISILGTTQFGYYALGIGFSNLLLDIPMAMVSVAFPHFMQILAKNDLKDLIYQLENYLSFLFFMIFPFFAILLFYGIDVIILAFLDKYVLTIYLTKVLSFASLFMGAGYLLHRYLLAKRKFKNLIITNLISILSYFISFFLIDIMFTIDEKLYLILYSFLFSQIIFFCSSLYFTYIDFNFTFFEIVKKILYYLIFSIVFFILLFCIENIIFIESKNLIDIMLNSFIKIILSYFSLSLLIILGFKFNFLSNELKKGITNVFRKILSKKY